MSIRLTQQVLLTGYVTDPPARVSAVANEVLVSGDAPARVSGIAIEVLRTQGVVSSGGDRRVQYIICSG